MLMMAVDTCKSLGGARRSPGRIAPRSSGGSAKSVAGGGDRIADHVQEAGLPVGDLINVGCLIKVDDIVVVMTLKAHLVDRAAQQVIIRSARDQEINVVGVAIAMSLAVVHRMALIAAEGAGHVILPSKSRHRAPK